jgi:adenylate cyclase
VSNRVQVRIYEDAELVYTHELTGPVELGRQSKDEEEPFHLKMEAGRRRLIIARYDEQNISRRYILIERVAGGMVRLTNLSATRPLQLPDVGALGHEEFRDLALPVILALGSLAVRIQEVETEEMSLHGLAEVTAPPRLSSLPSFQHATLGVTATGESKAFIHWLHAALDVLQSAASSADFLDKAARAAVELVNLDSARILLRRQNGWHPQATQSSPWIGAESEWQPSRAILARLLEEKRTFWEVPELSAPGGRSLLGIKAVVAAPILDRNGEVIGALYGDRRRESPLSSSGPITELEASLVELLARGVAAGLARLDQERAALEARVRFEQFFTPQLARQLERNPDLLQGRDAEVTLLFCDMRNFSRISERLGPARTVAWISDTMATLSECVRAHQGVLVDYIGDELIAMWGAPEEQPDHARLGCRAALDMLDCLPQLNGRWQAELKEPMSFGIGVNTGVARVGNMGSPHKFKYGPLGNSVNLASRVQGATKYLKCRLLITGATQAHLDGSFLSRRLARVRVVHIDEPVDLYELSAADRLNWLQAKAEYEKSLELFEKKEFLLAARTLGNWRARMPDDGPALILLHRAIQCEVEEPNPFDPVWELPGK